MHAYAKTCFYAISDVLYIFWEAVFFWFCVVALWSVVTLWWMDLRGSLFSFRIILFFNKKILIMLYLTAEFFFVFFPKSSSKISIILKLAHKSASLLIFFQNQHMCWEISASGNTVVESQVVCIGDSSVHKPGFSLLAISYLVSVKWHESKSRNIPVSRVVTQQNLPLGE